MSHAYCDVTEEGTYSLFAFQSRAKHSSANSITTAVRLTTTPNTMPMIAPVFKGVGAGSVAVTSFTEGGWENQRVKYCSYSYM